MRHKRKEIDFTVDRHHHYSSNNVFLRGSVGGHKVKEAEEKEKKRGIPAPISEITNRTSSVT